MRLFVAVDLPPEPRAAVARVIEALRTDLRGARWVPADNIHLTLAFLGETEAGPEIERLLGETAPGVRSTATYLEGVGAFPSARRSRVLWVGLADPEGRLSDMARAVQVCLEPAGFVPESRPFSAHLTIARFSQPGPVRDLAEVPVEPVRFGVDHLTLFRSRLGRPHPVYEPIGRFPLGAG